MIYHDQIEEAQKGNQSIYNQYSYISNNSIEMINTKEQQEIAEKFKNSVRKI